LIQFSPERRLKKLLLRSKGLISEMVCYEPGQQTVTHHHPAQDEVFYCIEGKGTIFIDNQRVHVQPSSVVFVPAQTPHGIAASEGGRLVVLFVKGPGHRKFNVGASG
jgi:quercetin dioxygenase-like cupin family protein